MPLTARETIAFLPDPSARLTRAFEVIGETRMRDMPFINRALSVEACGFHAWSHHWLGVLITPWTMNLILTPRDARYWTNEKQGGAVGFSFPFGHYDFIVAREALLGEGLLSSYLMCALFSPALNFIDQEAARATAEEILKALFVEDNEVVDPFQPKPTMDEKMNAPLSKRDFLRGRFLTRQPL